ncbi:unnamed protein product [Ceratitis capitata]|uniref:(Mediterranean fruit fly) hypothetical protein n=1 Tax=Ceratitis capitata TaxID=7213 RepID=A0A811UPQ0_CERCA|nr:unnamed protein product [Ceratitis capitata]
MSTASTPRYSEWKDDVAQRDRFAVEVQTQHFVDAIANQLQALNTDHLLKRRTENFLRNESKLNSNLNTV